MKHYGYPSIPVFRIFLQDMINRKQYIGRDANNDPIFDRTIELPVIKLTGAVKLHGSNASIVYTKNDEYYSQSREVILNNNIDLNNFYQFSVKVKDHITEVMKKHIKDYDALIIFGEWCGKGVQKGVAISKLEKMYVLFGVAYIKDDTKHWLNNSLLSEFKNEEMRIFNIYDFKTYSVNLNLADPEASIEELEKITSSVESECPVGKHFGVSGSGEGVVYFYDDKFNGPMPVKLKGIKHSTARVKKIIEIDPIKVKSIEDFVEYSVTDNRLNQGMSYLKNNGIKLDKPNVIHFINWIKNDIVKEESDVLAKSNLKYDDVKATVDKASRLFYFSKVT